MSAPRETKLCSVRKLRSNKKNPRTHSKKQIRQIAESIRRFGWTFPILVDEDLIILAGYGRYAASLLLGLREVPIIAISGLTDAEKRALALADNKIAANAGWDRALLAAELGELARLLPECDLDLEITGFEAAEIDALMGDLIDPEQDPSDEIGPVSSSPVSRRGDLWLAGPHRLFCGDAKSSKDVRKLMAGARATMVFADPPYNVPVKSIQGRGKIRHREFVEASGELSPEEFTAFLTTAFTLAAHHSADGSIHYVCMDWRHIWELLVAGRNVHYHLENLVVWVKSNAGQGSFYRSQHELICVFKKGLAAHRNNIELGRHGRNRSNIWHYAGVNSFRAGRLEELSVHPTAKPVALIADAIRDASRRGEIILDPFLGSGSTIMAAERVGRRGYGLELDPRYVDVAVRRWENFTKRDAVLAGTTKTFGEISAERASIKAGTCP